MPVACGSSSRSSVGADPPQAARPRWRGRAPRARRGGRARTRSSATITLPQLLVGHAVLVAERVEALAGRRRTAAPSASRACSRCRRGRRRSWSRVWWRAERRLALEHDDPGPRPAALQLARGGQPDDPAADDAEIDVHRTIVECSDTMPSVLVTGASGFVGAALDPAPARARGRRARVRPRRGARARRRRAASRPAWSSATRSTGRRPRRGAGRRRGRLLARALDGGGRPTARSPTSSAARPSTSPRPRAKAGVRRVVYLGGPVPAGRARSRRTSPAAWRSRRSCSAPRPRPPRCARRSSSPPARARFASSSA